MKIVHLIAHLELGGAEVFVTNLIKYQISKNIKLELWCLEKSRNEEFEKKTIEELKKKNIKVIILTKRKNRIKRIINLVETIRRFKPDIINSHLSHVTIYALLGKILACKYNLKIIETIHSTKLSRKKYHQLFSNYLVNKTIAITEKVKENLIINARVNKNKIIVIENGIELPKDKIKIKAKVENIISVGRLSSEKNHIFLLKAYELLKKDLKVIPKLKIYGDGNMKEKLQEYIEKNNLQKNIELMGTTSNIIEKLRESDLYIMSSKYEGLSISLLEALGVGIPIIATKVPGIEDVLMDGKTSTLVELDNVLELKNAIKNLLNDYNKRNYYSDSSLILSKEYSLDKKAIEYNKLYENVLNNVVL